MKPPTTTTPPTTASGEAPPRWTDPPDLIAARTKMREIFQRLENLLAEQRRQLEEP